MSPAEFNLIDDWAIMQGDDFSLVLTVAGSEYTGVDFSDPGWLFEASLRSSYSMSSSDDPVDFAVSVDDGTVGVAVVTLSLTAAQTAAMSSTRSWVWDCQVTDPDGVVLTLLRGPVVSVVPQVTVSVAP